MSGDGVPMRYSFAVVMSSNSLEIVQSLLPLPLGYGNASAPHKTKQQYIQ